jgi:hypothetical protein
VTGGKNIMKSNFPSLSLIAFNLFVALAVVSAADVASAQLGDALKGAAHGAAQGAADGSGATDKANEAAATVDQGKQAVDEAKQAAAGAGTLGAMAPSGDLTGAAKVGSGVAVEQAVQGGDMKAAGQKGVAAGVDTYMGGAPTDPTAPAAGDALPAGE